MTTADALEYGVENGDIVEVEVGQGSGRSLTFGDVLIRVKDSYRLEMHIDTDEGNAAELKPRSEGELEVTDGEASIRRG
jgi:acetate kinase